MDWSNHCARSTKLGVALQESHVDAKTQELHSGGDSGEVAAAWTLPTLLSATTPILPLVPNSEDW
jgi:hypothetical protein